MLENETVLQSFRNSIHNQEHQSCYKHFLDLIILAADATGMTARQMSRIMQLGLPMAPWYDATRRDYKRRIRRNKKHNQPFAELQLPAEKKQFKKEMADEMVGLTDARSPEVYKLLTANKRSDTSLISAESWTEHLQSHFVQPQESFPDVLPGRSKIPTRHQLLSDQLRPEQVFPSDTAVPPGLVAGTGA